MLFLEQKRWWKRNEDMKGEDRAERKGRGALGTPCCCASCKEVLAKQGASTLPLGEAGSQAGDSRKK